MPITVTVEDGSIVPNANSYVAVAYVDDYHAQRGRLSWADFSDEKKKACVILATDYVDKRFGNLYRGIRRNQDQYLQWPRLNAWDDGRYLYVGIDDIPRKLKQAIAEYALRAGLVGELAPDPIPMVARQDLTPAVPEVLDEAAGGPIRRISEKVDKLEETKTFSTPDQLNRAATNRLPTSTLVTEGNIPEYPAADLLMKELIRSGQSRTIKRGS